jgi:hypothetical protein
MFLCMIWVEPGLLYRPWSLEYNTYCLLSSGNRMNKTVLDIDPECGSAGRSTVLSDYGDLIRLVAAV